MIIVMGNSYPKLRNYVDSHMDSHDEYNKKDFALVYDNHTAMQCWSIIAKEIRIIEIIDWLDPTELFNLIRRLRIQR